MLKHAECGDGGGRGQIKQYGKSLKIREATPFGGGGQLLKKEFAPLRTNSFF